MALQITEFTEGGASFAQSATLAVLPSTTTQSIAVSGTSTQSEALSATTRMVRIVADENCRISSGTNPTATASSMPIQAGVTEYFGIPPGSNLKIAVISY